MSPIVQMVVSIVALVLGIWSGWMVYKQYRYRVLIDLHQELLGDEMQKSLRWVFAMEAARVARPTEAELVHIERVLGAYDLIGLRAKQGAISSDHLLASEWRIVIPLAKKLEPFLEKQRQLRNCASYKEFFVWLVERAEDYRRRKHPTEIPHSFAKQDLLRHDGCSIIFVNDDHELLLYQRDNDPSIPEPGNWDLFGGSIESDEEPDQAIVREVAEEIGISGQPTGICLAQHHFFRKYSFDDRDDYVYWCRLNEPANKLWTTEGRDPTWFSPEQIEQKEDIAFAFKRVLVDFSKWLRDGKRW